MERVVLTLGNVEVDAARDPQRGLLVLWEAQLRAAGATLTAPPPRAPSPNCSRSRSRSHGLRSPPRRSLSPRPASPPRSPSPPSSHSSSESHAWRRSPARLPPRPPVARRPRVPPAAAPAPEPAAAPPRRRRRGNRAGVQERARRVARAQEAGTRRQAAPAREHPFGSPPPPSPFRVWVNGGSPPAPASAARGALQSRATPAAQVSASPFFLQPVPQCLPPWLHRLRPDLPRNARS